MESPLSRYIMLQEAKAIFHLGGQKSPPNLPKTKIHQQISLQSNLSSHPRIKNKDKLKLRLKCITHQEESQISVLGDELFKPEKNLILNKSH